MTTEAERVQSKGYDGLYSLTEACGCFVDDLRPCGEVRTGCRMGMANEIGVGPGRPKKASPGAQKAAQG